MLAVSLLHLIIEVSHKKSSLCNVSNITSHRSDSNDYGLMGSYNFLMPKFKYFLNLLCLIISLKPKGILFTIMANKKNSKYSQAGNWKVRFLYYCWKNDLKRLFNHDCSHIKTSTYIVVQYIFWKINLETVYVKQD